ncbi:MAG TPA: transglutaminase-like domain-containing protein, partial [Verrucomicrobiae bacterium]|nr:transglutaminase-like domain-containing protein [Verrucomicrobiae bacterium]
LGLHARTPLSDFLLKTRAGHCEYFATATVLLLRHYGIPARYATGYAVQELAREEDAYIIRERHGHAWAVACIDSRWVEVDSTPGDWAEAEANEFPGYEDLKDAWARFTFGFMEWRWLGDWAFFRLAAPWLVIPMTVFLVWRIFGRRMSRAQPPLRETQEWPGADSEFFRLERQLAKAGLARHNDETVEHWLRRISVDAPGVSELLRRLMRLHLKYRFGEAPVDAAERSQMKELVQLCSAQL